MESLKIVKGGYKQPISLTTILISAIAFFGLLFIKDIQFLSYASKPKQIDTNFPKEEPPLVANSSGDPKDKSCSGLEEDVDDEEKVFEGKQRPPFDPKRCSVVEGSWVFNRSAKPLYTDASCPYLDQQVTCAMNGRPDDGYLHWQWQPDGCDLPRFDAAAILEKLRGKRLMFVGDSLQRAQWRSLVCSVQSHLAPEHKSMRDGASLSIFKAKEYNASIEFYWAPFLVESNTDMPIQPDLHKRVVRVDSISKHASHWVGVDFLVFNTYVWWTNGFRIKALWGSFANGEDGYEELDAEIAYRLGLKTWANWVDSNLDPNKTRVFFTTMSPTHMRSEEWHNPKGIQCYNETRPIMKRGYSGSGTNKNMMQAVREVIERMKVQVSVLNVTQLSEYRVDAHTSVYTELYGKVYSKKEKSNPRRYADCIHWCLPGVPDTWNQVLYAYL